MMLPIQTNAIFNSKVESFRLLSMNSILMTSQLHITLRIGGRDLDNVLSASSGSNSHVIWVNERWIIRVGTGVFRFKSPTL